MIKAKIKNIKPKSVFINKDTGKYTIFMEEMVILIGKTFDFEKSNTNEYVLARTDFNYTHGLVDEYFYLAVFVYEWLEVSSNDFSINELKLPVWINEILKQVIL